MRKLIIDTDPGVDDAMAILAAFSSPEVEVVGLTTIYGNVPTSLATHNALALAEYAEHPQVPVAQGAAKSLKGNMEDLRIADFVHGSDGLGNVGIAEPKGKAVEGSAAAFIVKMVNDNPGKITILALAPLTNIAEALMLDPDLGSKWEELVILGGAFFVNGNVNPAAEANIFGDPEAADFVLGKSSKIKIMGLDVTCCCQLSAEELEAFKGQGRYGSYVHAISQFYLDFHRKAFRIDAIHLHDPAAFAAVVNPDWFSWTEGAVRVVTEGIAMGNTILDATNKNWMESNGWSDRPHVQVALKVDAPKVVQFVKDRLTGRH